MSSSLYAADNAESIPARPDDFGLLYVKAARL